LHALAIDNHSYGCLAFSVGNPPPFIALIRHHSAGHGGIGSQYAGKGGQLPGGSLLPVAVSGGNRFPSSGEAIFWQRFAAGVNSDRMKLKEK
jgi:hypothetical protein